METYEDEISLTSELNVVVDEIFTTDNSGDIWDLGNIRVPCDECLIHNQSKEECVSMCWECDMHLCSLCQTMHTNHKLLSRDSPDVTSEAIVESILTEDNTLDRICTENISLCDRIDARHSSDNKDSCEISSMCMLTGGTELLIADEGNKCIKIVNVTNGAITRVVKLRAPPWGIAEIISNEESDVPLQCSSLPITETKLRGGNIVGNKSEDKMLGITFPTLQKIIVFSMNSDKFLGVIAISVKGKCRSVVHHSNLFITCCKDPYSVQFLTINGDLHRVIENEQFDKPMFNGPLDYLAFNPVNNMLYISCFYDEAVKAFKVESNHLEETAVFIDQVESNHLEGTEVFIGQAEGDHLETTEVFIDQPKDIAIDNDGNLFVCCWKQIAKVSSDLTNKTIVFDDEIAIELPQAICLYKNKLYVSHGWSPTLKSTITVLRIE